MLDLIAFAAAIAITKYIGQKNPLLSPSSPSNAGDRAALVRRVARHLFHGCLLVSLCLFSLAILEAAPRSWLVVLDRTALFVAWYRALLWALCLLLLVVHPAFLGVVVGASLWPPRSSPAAKKASPSPTHSPSHNRKNSEGRGHSRLLILCRSAVWILWISVRFFLWQIVWRLLRSVAGAITPFRIHRVRRTDGRSGDDGAKNKQGRTLCTPGIVMAASLSLCLSFVSLATIGSLTLRHVGPVDRDGLAAADGDRDAPYEVDSVFGYLRLEFMVSVLCAVGMIVASLLNGFGCASMPHAHLVGVFLEPTPPALVAKAEEDRRYVVKQWEDKRWLLAEGLPASSSASRSPRSPPSSFAAFAKATSPDDKRIQRIKLQEEVLFLETLAGDMSDDISEMKQSQQLALRARTASGRVRGIVGVVFSVVLVVRVVLAANSFLSLFEGGGKTVGSSNSRDPLTSISLWLLGRNIIVKTPEQYDLFRQGTSLVLAGALSISQVRAFLRVVGALGRRLSRTCRVSSGHRSCMPLKSLPGLWEGGDNTVALLLSSFVMGCYFLACVTVVKMTLPTEYRSAFSTAVGLTFNFNTQLLNMVFFGSSCVSALTLASLFGIQRNNSERYQLDSQLSATASQLA